MSPINIATSIPRKRPRVETEDYELNTQPSKVQPQQTTETVENACALEALRSGTSRTFTPICLLPRANLPLAYLDPAASCGGRLWSANIRPLEERNDGDVPVVLIVKETDDNNHIRLSAVERMKPRVYAMCRLACWVSLEDVTSRASASVRKSPDDRMLKRLKPELVRNSNSLTSEPWWKKAALDVDIPAPRANMAASKASSAVRETLQLNMLRSGASATENRDTPKKFTAEPSAIAEVSPPSAATPDGILQELAKRYVEALYVSRTSLAYFAKGPLARARAAFSSAEKSDEVWSTTHLIDFLRTSILSSATMDKKYKTGIPDLLRALRDRSPDPKKRKKRKKWKPKRDKCGFFVGEQEYLETCWPSTEVDGSSQEEFEMQMRDKLDQLRERESFLQVILVLEILALEACVIAGPLLGSPALDPQPGHAQHVGSNTKKPKKEQDLLPLLEILLDRLCIWHSLSLHDTTKRVSSRGGCADVCAEVADSGDRDDISNFCIDVVIPFYASRIPKYATIVNQKFGGPSPPTPVKGIQPTGAPKPGQPAIRQPPEKRVRKPLERVSTDTLNQASSKRPPSLHRSATDSDAMLSYIKRENSSSPSLEAIPFARQSAQPRKRVSLLHQVSFDLGKGRREVDLTAMSQANEAKLRKKAETEAKLQEAIATLKKPNRERAVAELADSRDGKNSTTHVAATPKHVRRRPGQAVPSSVNVVPASSMKLYPQHSSARTAIGEATIASTPSLVPQTNHRARFQSHGDCGPTATPSRNLHRSKSTHLETPLPSMHALIQQTPSKATLSGLSHVFATPRRPPKETATETVPSVALEHTRSEFLPETDFATPPRPASLPLPREAISLRTERQEPQLQAKDDGERSIYEALGWEGDDGGGFAA